MVRIFALLSSSHLAAAAAAWSAAVVSASKAVGAACCCCWACCCPCAAAPGLLTSTTSFHWGVGEYPWKSPIICATSPSSLIRLWRLYRTTTTRPTVGLATGMPRAVLIPNWTAPPRRSKR